MFSSYVALSPEYMPNATPKNSTVGNAIHSKKMRGPPPTGLFTYRPPQQVSFGSCSAAGGELPSVIHTHGGKFPLARVFVNPFAYNTTSDRIDSNVIIFPPNRYRYIPRSFYIPPFLHSSPSWPNSITPTYYNANLSQNTFKCDRHRDHALWQMWWQRGDGDKSG